MQDLPIPSSEELSAVCEPFDSFWEAPEDVESGYSRFATFYRRNYLKHFPTDRSARILCVSCGPGYMVNLLKEEGYENVLGIDGMPEKIKPAQKRGLNCRSARAFEFLKENGEPFGAIFCEQELNHLTKREMLAFLRLCRDNLREGGVVIAHSLNGANPIVGAENLAMNIDHFNTLTEYSLGQMLRLAGFGNVEVFPLNLYVFYSNPLNYAGMAFHAASSLLFRLFFLLYGKSAKIFTKKIGVRATKGSGSGGAGS